MKKINITLCSVFFVIFFSSLSFSAISNEQKKIINSLSDEQLYDLYVNQLASLFIVQANGRIDIPDDFSIKFNKCFKVYVKKTFTAKEVKDLYVQPENFNRKSAYDRLKKLEMKYKECIAKGMK